MTYLIPGGAGFIGSNIAEHLINNGHSVRVLDNFESGFEHNLSFADGLGKDKFELIRGDIRDPEAVDKATAGADYVLCQAALKSVPKSLTDPEGYNDVNINGILQLLKAAYKHNVKRFVFASSSSVYGDVDEFPQKESMYPQLFSPYALTKLAGEYYCRIFSEIHNLETVSLRYFNVFGPRQALDDEYSAVIPKFIDCVDKNEPPPIFGDGTQSRDFTYIDNVVQANILAATVPGLKCEVFNAACGEEHSVLSIVDGINKAMGKDVKPVFLPKRTGDIYRSFSDISRLQDKTGYKPTVSFVDGLARTVEFFSSK